MPPFCLQALLESAVCCLRDGPLLPADSSRGAGCSLSQQLPCSLTAVVPVRPSLCESGFKAKFSHHVICYCVDEPQHYSRAFFTVLRTLSFAWSY